MQHPQGVMVDDIGDFNATTNDVNDFIEDDEVDSMDHKLLLQQLVRYGIKGKCPKSYHITLR